MATVMDAAQTTRRRTPRAAKTNSVFKKVVMATTGIIMILFLIAHMVGNLHVFQGARSFDDYATWLRTFGEPAFPPRFLLSCIEVILAVCVFGHMWAAFSLWAQAKRARPQGYVTKKSIAQSYASRTMRWGGVIIVAFIAYHLLDMSVGVVNFSSGTTPYSRLIASFTNPWVTAFYVISLVLLGFHLRHGIWSATQTLGQSNRRRELTVNVFAVVVAVLLTAGFLVTPLSIAFGFVS